MRDNGSEGAGEVEQVGPFRIYLGAAPGVGKTYAMLCEGHRRLARGTDVVAGFVESYGRPHTEELINGLEIIPRKVVDYRGRRLPEMDLERNWWHVADGGPILRRVIHEADAFGIDIHLIAHREPPHAKAPESSENSGHG